MSTIIFTVTNDLNYDQRMRRIAGTMAKEGYDVVLVGRKMKQSIPLQDRPYRQKRLSCFFQKGFLFYAEYNLRLFFYLLFAKSDTLCAIDLDTILPVYFASVLKKIKRVYDAHELFTEQKEIITRPIVHRFWMGVEKFAVPKFANGYTVNDALAKEFKKRYGVDYEIIRNLPLLTSLLQNQIAEKHIIYQGAVNEGRCFETLIPAMQFVPAQLHIYGTGNFLEQAKLLTEQNNLTEKIIFHGNVLPEKLVAHTQQAYIGITLFEAEGMNQYYSLANRFFDYIMAGKPQVCVNYPVYNSINKEYEVAYLIDNTEPNTIAAALNRLLEDEALFKQLQVNCLKAREELNWEKESGKLLLFYRELNKGNRRTRNKEQGILNKELGSRMPNIASVLTNHLHIICFSVPYPVDYGGAMDLFYKLPALQKLGIQIHLHCFDYGCGRQPALEKYCASVEYYERNMQPPGIINTLPYIVSSRKNEQLLQRLLRDDYPILMEGIHCTYLLLDARFSQRKCFVRLHNVEYKYYHDLYRHSSSILKKLYFRLESALLKKYEKKICNKAHFLAVTEQDCILYRNQLGCKSIDYLPLFIADWEIQMPQGLGAYCLYHGDLSIEANEKAVTWLLKKVFNKLQVSFVIAGKNPSEQLSKLIATVSTARLAANPTETEMQDLISTAQIHVMPSFTTTGIKIKLLNALYNGRHCLVNPATVDGSGLESACHTATTADAFQQVIAQLYHQPLGEEELRLRKKVLGDVFNNERSAKKIVNSIWG